MTGLLAPPSSRRSATDPAAGDAGSRWALVRAGLAGVYAAALGLALCLALGLAGWFATAAGSYGDTRDALRVGADAWLLALGGRLDVGATTVTAVPLGLSLVCVLAAYRGGRRAGPSVGASGALGSATAVLAAGHAVVAVVTAVLASTDAAAPHLVRSLLGGLLVGALAGGAGLAVGSGAAGSLTGRFPGWVRAAGTGAAATVLLTVAASALVVTAALLLDLGSAANVLARLHTGLAGGLLYAVVAAAVAPNVVLLGSAYLLGPGFAVGTGTVVSTSAVAIGPLPAFPLVAALPDAGATPGWASWLPVLPALLGVCGGALLVRRHRPERVEVAALEGLVAGLLAAAVVAALVGLAGGAVGPGRMSEVGAPVLDTWWAAVLALTPGCLVGAAGAAALGRWLPWRS
jgi:hypothetical protein